MKVHKVNLIGDDGKEAQYTGYRPIVIEEPMGKAARPADTSTTFWWKPKGWDDSKDDYNFSWNGAGHFEGTVFADNTVECTVHPWGTTWRARLVVDGGGISATIDGVSAQTPKDALQVAFDKMVGFAKQFMT